MSLIKVLESLGAVFGPPLLPHVFSIFEVGISYSGQTYAEGKKIGWKDGVRALWCILRYNLGR
ncbi:MAG: hypothetical protein FDZ69_02705 [Deltaproteobacteria bacterium]|nr:MAG: hypothetical protein FDZ69_02705 [Deltaproteobacteria bacterium]